MTTTDDLMNESSEISVNTFNHMFLGVSEKHGLSEYAKNLLKLCSMYFPDDNKIPKIFKWLVSYTKKSGQLITYLILCKLF